mmetsp:Transcript_7248/g.12128  ORF Transcript_7248/g.12128 Transcript_7248/m.12128 type:complete len:224 (+) Transcript_7248:795-1466(+)
MQGSVQTRGIVKQCRPCGRKCADHFNIGIQKRCGPQTFVKGNCQKKRQKHKCAEQRHERAQRSVPWVASRMGQRDQSKEDETQQPAIKKRPRRCEVSCDATINGGPQHGRRYNAKHQQKKGQTQQGRAKCLFGLRPIAHQKKSMDTCIRRSTSGTSLVRAKMAITSPSSMRVRPTGRDTSLPLRMAPISTPSGKSISLIFLPARGEVDSTSASITSASASPME